MKILRNICSPSLLLTQYSRSACSQQYRIAKLCAGATRFFQDTLEIKASPSALGPSHARRQSVGFQVARQRQYRILLLCPVCRICATQQLIPSVTASHQKHLMHGIELILFLMPDTWYWPIRAKAGGSYSGLGSKHQKRPISTRTVFRS